MPYGPSQAYNRAGYLVAVAVGAAVLIAVFMPPLLGDGAASVIRAAFTTLCHQLPDRTMHIGGEAIAACHRCVGIYAGIVGSALVYPLLVRHHRFFVRHAGPVILLSLVIPGGDWLGEVVGLWQNTPLSRTSTGFVFGFAAGYYFTLGVCGVMAGRTPAPATSTR